MPNEEVVRLMTDLPHRSREMIRALIRASNKLKKLKKLTKTTYIARIVLLITINIACQIFFLSSFSIRISVCFMLFP